LGLLGDADYDYAVVPYLQQQVPYWEPPPEEEEAQPAPLPVEEYQPPSCRRRRPSDGP
jgi:hypothetical protein